MGTLVGREALTAALHRLVDGARRGEGQLVLVGGEAGIGKTALVDDAARYAAGQGATVVWGACVDASGVPAFWPWGQVLDELGAAALPGATPDGATPDGATPDGDDGWFAAATHVVGALRRAAADGPVVVVLDDLQWAGGGCVRVLDLAARQLRRSPALLLGTYRDVEVDPDHPLSTVLGAAEVVGLSGLSESAVADLLREAVGERADALAPDVARRTGGNPFFVQQIARLLATSPSAGDQRVPTAAGDQRVPTAAGDQRVPAAVGEAVNRRIARLPESTARLLDLAAVAGSDVDAAVLADAADVPYADVVARLGPAVSARVLRLEAVGRYRFEHDLYRETRYQDQDPASRARAHRAVAETLRRRLAAGADVRSGDIAHHYAHAIPAVTPEQALAQVRAAALDAERRRAHEEAARHWAQAVRLAEMAGTVPTELRLTLGDALLRAGRVTSARAVYLAIATAAGGASTPDEVGRAALGLHRCGATSGISHAQTIDLLSHAVSIVDESAAPGLAARVWAALARELADGPDMDEPRAHALAAEAVRLAEGDPAGDALAFCLLAQHDVEWGPGTATARLAIAERMEVAAQGQPDLAFEARLCRFVALVELADPRAEAALREMEAYADRLGQPHHRYLALSRRAAITLAAGDLAAGAARVEEARELADALGEPDGIAVHLTQAMTTGQLRGGALGLGRLAREHPGPVMPAELAPHERAFRQLADGHPDTAAATLRAGVDVEMAAMFRWRALAEAALVIEIAVATGATDLCDSRYRSLRPYAGGLVVIGGVVSILGPVDLFLGMAAAATGDLVAARRHLTDAADLAVRFGALTFAIRAQVELAHVLHLLGEQAEARRLAQEWGPTADRIGLDLVAERAAELIRHPVEEAALRRTDQVWTLTFAGHTAQLPDAKGLQDLAVLLGSPGQEIAALRLVGAPEPDTGSDEVLDEQARAAYKRRLAELESELDSADVERAAAAERERAALIAELARTYGLGGRVRRLGDRGEKARSTVTNRIRDTLRRIERVHPALAEHLRRSVVTGRTCVYRPDPPVRWHVSHGL
jgi:hypothetical protein